MGPVEAEAAAANSQQVPMIRAVLLVGVVVADLVHDRSN
jgi:hypothetical protein